MERIISQVRWPTELYLEIKEMAYQERKSVNSMVVELAAERVKQKKEEREINAN